MREQPTVTWAGVAVERGTDRAILVRRADGQQVWVPSSVVHDDSPCWRPGDAGAIILHAWWVNKPDRPLRVWRKREGA